MFGFLSDSDVVEIKSYVGEIKPLIILATLVFFISAVLGYLFTSMNPDSAGFSLQELESLVELIEGLSPLQIMLFIFLNNSIKSLFAILLGVFLGIIPFIFLAYNGFILGVVAYIFGSEKSLLFVLAAILPHGLIELPMIFISVAIGMRVGIASFDIVRGRPSNVKAELSRGLSIFFRFVVPMLLIAAVVETFITPFFIISF
ncbi:stage II sporulation protein M [Methanohalophilus levihalophilus]|uniref:stage II sporulation protein M n=1 Tax=Methanohalophilus levihalophilus TaxID=1431282 RepID=UPI001AE843BF|nr:stage II sporulation protein M [Methanohalophilus levihalophilus]MBP2029180.1 stage II sporulation protein M [Methanohalophilus levihalophilus]